MPTKELMNWVAGEKRWRVQKDKKTYWFNPATNGLPATKEGSVRGANEYWEKKEAELNQAKQRFWDERKNLEQYDANIEELKKIISIHEQIGDVSKQELIDTLKLKLSFLEKARSNDPELKPLKRSQKSPLQITPEDTFGAVVESIPETKDVLILPDVDDFDRFYASNNDLPDSTTLAVLEDRLKYYDKIIQSRTPEPPPKDKSVGFFIDRFVQRHRKRCDAGEISIERVDKVNSDLGKFGSWFGRERSIEEIDIRVVEGFYNWVLDQMAMRKTDPKAGYSRPYAKDILAIFKSFLRDLDEDNYISAPKKVYSKTAFVIKNSKTINETVSLDDVRKILDGEQVEERTKLFVLLALNCGMYQSDISDLRQDEVDWIEGRIIRARSKTRESTKVPVVNYKLWDRTFALLKKYRAPKSGELVFLNRYQTPLRTMEFVEGSNRGTKSDCVSDAWVRARTKLKMEQCQFKHFRKTSSDLIYNHSEFRGLEGVFLCHAPRTVSEEYYTNACKGILDPALLWLGEELKIVDE